MKLIRALICLAMLVVGGDGMVAQTSASVGAAVLITTTGLTIANNASLDFGTVIPSVVATVDPQTDAGAGEVEIRGAAGAEVAISFVLPTQLTVGPHSMPISFGANSGCHAQAFAFFRGFCTYFDPSVTLVTRLPNFFFFPPVRFLWLGGTVSPQPGQFPGIYRGSAQLTVSYTGN